MSDIRFLLQLLAVSIGCVGLTLGLQQVSWVFTTYAHLAWLGLGLFVGLSVLMYWSSKIAAQSSNQFLFSRLTMLFVLLKMVLTIGVVMVYQRRYLPNDRFFVVPFLMMYLIFTVFETYFLLQLVQQAKRKA